MITLSTEAAEAVRTAMTRAGKPEAGLRVMIEVGGCAGNKYMIGLDTEPKPDDAVVVSEGVKLFVDPQSQPLLAGLTIGFVETLAGKGFTFDNPNATASCSCGKSFG
ncbi:HesB/YadR/YfhF [Rhodovulum sp. PH10]|uniref:HesB/IscA family protein n=1 Tax=Rhodovulum sp. PH10 TaxID=1187851 RepID=UPI00027C1E9F|nr:iron-sulfur cluster assembly accessory protein [Rhodovulum sp. PH10]EJW10395.1 HesB/YadR/YfhF [Rhodovulum sp. PH10]